MKVKYTLDRNAPKFKKDDVLSKVMRQMGAKVTISGDVIIVDGGFEEKKVADMLNHENVAYSRST